MEAPFIQARSLTRRTVHIKMYPTARTFAERREVFRVLERFGEVSMFQSFKYDPRSKVQNAFLSIFTSESAAQEMINASPIRYKLVTEAANPSGSVFSPKTTSDSAKPNQEETPRERLFEIYASSSAYNHEVHLRSPVRNPLHGPFTPITPRQSYIAASLDRVIPKSLWSAGLRDWDTAPLKLRSDDNLDASEIAKAMESRVGNEAKLAVQQYERRIRAKAMPRVMKGLRQLREETEAKKQKEAQKESTGQDNGD